MPGDDTPDKTEYHGQIPPGERDDLGDSGRNQTRECRICGTTIHDPFPNQFECLECEGLESQSDGDHLEIPEAAGHSSEVPEIVPGSEDDAGSTTPGPELDLQTAIERSNLPPLEMKPEDIETILDRIDGAGNENKFRTLHLEGDWERYYDEDEYDNPYETAVVGYLRIVAFYTQLSVIHMEAFYRASALYDSDFWRGWNRLNALESAIESQSIIYGRSPPTEECRNRAQVRLNHIERKMDRSPTE